MAKLFIQTLPSQEEIQQSVSQIQPNADTWALHSHLMLMKVATEFENHFDTFLAPFNLSSGRFTLLLMLNREPGGLMPSELSQRVGVTQATISGLLNGLEKAELLRREVHEKDGRAFVIKITEKGQNVIKDIFPRWSSHITQFWSRFPEEERNFLSRTLEGMVHHVAALGGNLK
ncbi:MAG: MarR family transcriptional regulator [Bdellovibrio sp.]